MTNCDLCGKEAPLFHTLIEGSAMDVCKGCASFGKVTAPPGNGSRSTFRRPVRLSKELEEPAETLVKDFGQRIRAVREQLKMEQKDFAKKINEKVSILQKIESGEFRPSLDHAKKLEKMLNIRLFEATATEEPTQKSRRIPDQVTIGDLIKWK